MTTRQPPDKAFIIVMCVTVLAIFGCIGFAAYSKISRTEEHRQACRDAGGEVVIVQDAGRGTGGWFCDMEGR